MNISVKTVAQLLGVVVVLTALSGCEPAPKSTNTKADVPTLRELPVSMKVRQRSTTRVPGSQQSLHLTIDDITRGQVMASLKDSDGKPVIAPTSLEEGGAASFSLGEADYQLQLVELDDSLTGDDYASFVISIPTEKAEPVKSADSESAIIEELLKAVEASDGVIFIRNDEEHSAKEAADHLRMKWKSAGGEIITAEEFIDKIATKSSISNDPYRVRKPDGTEVESAEYLHEKLREINAKR